jgi:hypothetical protein
MAVGISRRKTHSMGDKARRGEQVNASYTGHLTFVPKRWLFQSVVTWQRSHWAPKEP